MILEHNAAVRLFGSAVRMRFIFEDDTTVVRLCENVRRFSRLGLLQHRVGLRSVARCIEHVWQRFGCVRTNRARDDAGTFLPAPELGRSSADYGIRWSDSCDIRASK